MTGFENGTSATGKSCLDLAIAFFCGVLFLLPFPCFDIFLLLFLAHFLPTSYPFLVSTFTQTDTSVLELYHSTSRVYLDGPLFLVIGSTNTCLFDWRLGLERCYELGLRCVWFVGNRDLLGQERDKYRVYIDQRRQMRLLYLEKAE